jgi:L-fucose mutarotase/ribose pyranase (RbsD/FucU family)
MKNIVMSQVNMSHSKVADKVAEVAKTYSEEMMNKVYNILEFDRYYSIEVILLEQDISISEINNNIDDELVRRIEDIEKYNR